MASKATGWAGRGLTFLVSALLIMSAVMKLRGGPEFDEGMLKMGIPGTMRVPLGILELTCVLLYLLPPTSVLGAILLTGYMGGAICTHWRIGDSFAMQAVIGVLIWLGICLRDDRLWQLIPLRTKRPIDL